MQYNLVIFINIIITNIKDKSRVSL